MKIRIVKASTIDIKVLLGIQKCAFKPLYEIYKDEQSPYLHTEDDILARMKMQGSD